MGIQPKMSPCEQSELQSIPAGSLNKCTEALNNAISWQDQKWKSLNIRSTVGDCSNQAIEKAHAVWDKLNAKEWMNQNISIPQVKTMKPSLSMLSKAMIFLCLLP